MLMTVGESNLRTVNLGSDPETAQAILDHCDREGVTLRQLEGRMIYDGCVGLPTHEMSRKWDRLYAALQELLKIAGKEDTKCQNPQ